MCFFFISQLLLTLLGKNERITLLIYLTIVRERIWLLFQFANTAKRMKNTPKVNEVLDDDALLKRYRKEILDLKKQLEEVWILMYLLHKYTCVYGHICVSFYSVHI